MSLPATLADAARAELAHLWRELATAYLRPRIGRSIVCDNLAARIQALTVHVGPTPWEKVSLRLVVDGTYQRIHDEIGVAVEVDMETAQAQWTRQCSALSKATEGGR